MGFSIRSELASYARLKRRCYFLFVISYGGLLAGLTYAAMTHQSPAPLDRAHPRGRPLRPSAPAAHAKLASLPFPRPARGRLRPHHLCPAGSGPVAHRGRGAGRRGGAGPHLPLLYPVQYAGKRRHTQKIRPGSEAEGLPRDGGMRFAAPCSRFSLSSAASPFACKRTKPRLGARAVRRSTGKGRRRAEKSNGSGRRKEEEAFRKEAPPLFQSGFSTIPRPSARLRGRPTDGPALRGRGKAPASHSDIRDAGPRSGGPAIPQAPDLRRRQGRGRP